nr:hypothetical protein [Tanacetum cinerariifolium]
CCWPATRQMEEDDEVEEATNNEAGDYNEMYCNMSRALAPSQSTLFPYFTLLLFSIIPRTSTLSKGSVPG